MSGAGLSEVAIYNIALDIIEEPPATTPQDDRASVRYMRRNFKMVRDGLLAIQPWHWAIKRGSLAADPIVPTFGWSYRYAIPSDCVRMLPLTTDGDFEGEPIPYELESGFILTSTEAPLLVRYIWRVDETGLLPQLFVDMVAGRLAYRAASKIVGKNSYVDRAKAFFDEAKRDAEQVNKVEAGTPERPYDTDFISVREGGIRW
jgi:hypothetical protein